MDPIAGPADDGLIEGVAIPFAHRVGDPFINHEPGVWAAIGNRYHCAALSQHQLPAQISAKQISAAEIKVASTSVTSSSSSMNFRDSVALLAARTDP